MPWIHFRKARPSIEVPVGTELMQALLDHGIPVASSCRGDGICAKCRIEIVSPAGAELTEIAKNLSPENDSESFLRERHGLEPSERISCQTRVLGDITVDTTYW